ncbi:MAG: PAS domain-containing protein [Bradymonadales bacterium]|nr:PAS domain-containing protein [Bradymonadales bacterium]
MVVSDENERLVMENQELLRRVAQTEKLLTQIQEMAHIGSWTLDLGADRLTWSDEVYRIFGLDPQEFAVTPKGFLEAVHPKDRLAVDEAYTSSLREGTDTYEIEHRIVRRHTGEIRFVQERCIHERNEAGEVARSVGIVQDITERRRAEEALRASEEKYRTIFDEAAEGIVTMPFDGSVLTVNKTFARMHGYASPEEMQHVRLEDLDAPETALLAPERLRRLGEGESMNFDVEHYHKDGHTFFLNVSCRVVQIDGKAQYLGFHQDISERKRAQELLRQSEERLRLTLEAVNDGIWDWNLLTGKAVFSPGYYTMLGYEPYEFPQSYAAWRSLLHPEDLERAEAEINEKIASNQGYVIEIRMLEKSGGWRWIMSRGKVVARDSLNRPIRMVGVHTDITDRKLAELEREKLQGQLVQAQKMEAVGRLAGGVAHDFNNMLGAILGYTDFALDQVDPTSPLVADLWEIRKAAERSAELTKQLLSFARKQTIVPKVLDPNQIVSQMLKMLRRVVGEDIDLVWAPGEQIGPVYMDPAQVNQIVVNLCVNARDAITDTGRITVKTESCVLDEEYCSSHTDAIPGEYVMLSVSDDGCGMDRSTVERLFEPFFTTKELGRGTGLGLSTIHGIVKQNGGHITVNSEPGRGTAINVYLPRYQQAETATPSASKSTVQRGLETILLVEDEPSVLALGVRILEDLGYTVLAAALPGEALHLARQHVGAIHLLITDVVMPEMNGRDLAKNLLSLFPDLRCLFLSGYPANVIVHQGIVNEGLHFLQKPFTRKELAAMLRKILDT